MSEDYRRTHPAVDFLLDALVGGLGRLPRRFVTEAGGLLAMVVAWPLLGKRRKVERNARRCGLERPRRLYRPASRELGRTAFEMIWMIANPTRASRERLRIEGLECLQQAAAEGRGVLLASGHFALWDLVGVAAASSGLAVAGTARSWRSPRLEKRLIELRERVGIKTFIRGEQGTGVAAYRWLRDGGIYCCMMDRFSGGRRIMIPFLGEGLHVPTGPAEMACRGRSAVVVGLAHRVADGSSVVRFRRLEEADHDDPHRLLWQVGALLEEQVRTWPQQWLWIFRRQPFWRGERAAGTAAEAPLGPS